MCSRGERNYAQYGKNADELCNWVLFFKITVVKWVRSEELNWPDDKFL